MPRDSGPFTLQDSFELGVQRDRSKDRIGANAAWTLKDWIPDLTGGPLRKRGAWEYKGTFGGSPSGWANAGIQALIDNTLYNLMATSSGQVYRVTAGGASWAIDGTTTDINLIKQNPILYYDLVFWPSYNGSQDMTTSDSNSTDAYTQTVTTHPEYLIAWKNRLIGASGETIIFGPPGSPAQAWDEDAAYVQTERIKGLISLDGVVLIGYDGHMDRMRGETPAGYGNVEDDISFKLMWGDIGLADAFSIAYWNSMAIWADWDGVYMSDGAAPIDLTRACGIKALWASYLQPLAASINAGDIRICSGVMGDLLHVSITNTSTLATVATFVIDLARRVSWEYQNCAFTTYFPAPLSPTLGGGELFAGHANSRIVELSHTFEFAGTNTPGLDENNVAIEPVIEFPYHRFAAGEQVIIDAYIGYAIEGIYRASVTIDPSGSNNSILYTAVDEGTAGNSITITYADTGSLSVAVVGTDITVNINAGVTTGTQVLAAVIASAAAAALVTPTAVGTITGTVAAVGSTALSGGLATPYLDVDFAYEPDPLSPTYDDYGDGNEKLYPKNIHGDEDEGYHYRRVPVRRAYPGLGVRIRQVGRSSDTRLYNLGVSIQPQPGTRQS